MEHNPITFLRRPKRMGLLEYLMWVDEALKLFGKRKNRKRIEGEFFRF